MGCLSGESVSAVVLGTGEGEGRGMGDVEREDAAAIPTERSGITATDTAVEF